MGIKRLLSCFMLTLAVITFALLNVMPAKAFDQNNLMDDGVFTNSTSMSPSQIDVFLNSFAGSCISQNNGFVTDDPRGWNPNKGGNGVGGYDFGPKVSGGQAIYDVAQLYKVNPQVILSTLQKEQSIVTGGKGCHYDRPNPADASQVYTCTINGRSQACTDACPFSYGGGCMNIALGYGCPGSCAVADEGFSMQLTLGTWLLRFGQVRAYGILTGYQGYEPGDENFTYNGIMTAGQRKASASAPPATYDGTSGPCKIHQYEGGPCVTITVANGATSTLYNFTPFLSGNQSFVDKFQTWFGSPYQLYTWSVISQYAYTDSTKQTRVSLGDLGPGQRYYIGMVVQNTGNVTWLRDDANPTRIGAASPRDRSSPFCDSGTWLGCNRPATIREPSVAPGQYGSFEFWVTTPTTPGTYNETFAPLVEGVTWMDNHTISFPMVVNKATYSWNTESQYMYTDSSKRTLVDRTRMVAGQHYYVVINVKNIGNMLWRSDGSNPTTLGTTNTQDHNSVFCDSTWLGCNRPTLLHEYAVATGQTGSFEFWIKAPANGSYSESFTPLVEGIAWMGGNYINISGTTSPAYYSWALINQYAYTDSSKSTPVNMGGLVAGQRYYIGFTLKNTGTAIWHQGTSNPFMLGAAAPKDRASPFCDSGTWLGCNRAASLHEYTVAPGQIGSFEFWIKAPSAGSYNEIYAPLVEGITWMDDHTVSFPAIVH
jgi:hypothetical protein